MRKRFLLAFITSVVFSGVSLGQSSGVSKSDNISTSKYSYMLNEAERQNALGNYSGAFELYRHCLKLNPKSGAARYGLANLLRYMREDSLSTKYVEEASSLYPDNYWYKDMLVKMYYNSRKVDDAQRVLESMAESFPEKSDVLMMLIDTYAQKQDYENLIKTLDKLEVKEGKSEQLSMEKFRIYVQMKDEASAFNEMSELAKEYPNDLRYQVLIGDLYFDKGTEESKRKALSQYKSVEAKDSNNVSMMLSMSNYYQKESNDSLCQHYILRLVTNPTLDRKVRLQLVSSLMYENLQSGGDSTQILNMFEKILSQPQEDVAMHELCVRYMASSKMSKEKLKPVLRQMIEIEPESELARNQLLAYAVEEADTASIYSLCKPACDYGIKDPVFYFYLGVVYYQQMEREKALETFQKGISCTDDRSSVELILRLHSLSGDLYHELGQTERAFQEYDSCLLYRPDDSYVLNNYAYYLSLQNKDLERAAKMSYRANQLEQDNPTNMDTYAWVLFKQKKYVEAREYIDKTLQLLGDSLTSSSSTIVEHAGDIYYRCGDKTKALDYWIKARELGKSEDIKALEKKIKKRKL